MFDTTAGFGGSSAHTFLQYICVKRTGSTTTIVQSFNVAAQGETGASYPTYSVSGAILRIGLTRGNTNTTKWYVELSISEMS